MIAFILALALAIHPAPGFVVFPMCTTGTRSLWEIEAGGPGVVDVSSSPSFPPRFTRHVRVRAGDTFFWTRSQTIYVRNRHAHNVRSATQDGTPC